MAGEAGDVVVIPFASGNNPCENSVIVEKTEVPTLQSEQASPGISPKIFLNGQRSLLNALSPTYGRHNMHPLVRRSNNKLLLKEMFRKQ